MLSCLLSAVGQAAGSLPTVSWMGQVYVLEGQDSELLDAAGKQRVQQALTRKLHTLQARGELPFVLDEGTELNNLTTRQGTGDEVPIGLIPVVVAGTSFDAQYLMGDNIVHKTGIISGLCVMLCKLDIQAGKVRPIGILPLYGYQEELSGNAPVSQARRRECFVSITEKLIDSELDFAAQKNITKNLMSKKFDLQDTWQVAKVVLGADNIRAEIGGPINPATGKRVRGPEMRKLRNIMAYAYTSQFQKTTGKAVYLPAGNTEARITNAIGDALGAGGQDNVSGLNIEYEGAPLHTVELNVTGANYGRASIAKRGVKKPFMVYQVWLKRTVDGKELELNDKQLLEYFESKRYNRSIEAGTMYRSMALDLAMKLGRTK